MSTETPNRQLPGDRDLIDRVDFCRAMLHLHDFLSGAENDKVKKRIKAWRQKHGYGDNNRVATTRIKLDA